MEEIIPIDDEFAFDELIIISQTDKEGAFTYVNKAFCEVSGYEQEEIIGKPHDIMRHPDTPKAVFTKLWDTIQSGQVFNGIVKNIRKDGRYYWLDMEILPIKNNEDITGFIAVGRAASQKDISDTLEAYSKITDTNVQ